MMLDEVVAGRTPATFPVHLLRGDPSVLDLCCAGFLGKNTATWCVDAGIVDYVGVDVDAAKVAEMRTLYSTLWEFHVGDIVTTCERFRALGRSFDVVIVDPWTQQLDGAWANLTKFVQVTKKGGALVIGAGEKQRREREVAEWVHRSNHMGGIWWAVILP